MQKERKVYRDNIIGKRVRKRRNELNLTQAELGKKVGCSSACISQIESGIRYPSVKTIKRLMKGLKTTSDYILGRHNNSFKTLMADDNMHTMLKGFSKLNETNKELFYNFFLHLQGQKKFTQKEGDK